MNIVLLRFLDLFKGIYRVTGADYGHVRAIVDVKLTMDNRRQHISARKKPTDEPSNTFLLTILFYSLFGAFIAAGLYGVTSFALAMMMFFSYLMVMVVMTLITDFSSILLDTSDNTIILPRPVSSRSLFAARITHIFLYLGQITLGLCLFPAVMVLIKFGPFIFCVFLLITLLAILASVFLTNTFYLLILQFASEEKLKNVINYFQIGIAVLIMAGYQLLPRLASRLELETFEFHIQWWNVFVPPIWMACAMEMIFQDQYDLPHISLTFLAVIIPVFGFYLVNKYLTPVFTRKLGIMEIETRQSVARTKKENWTKYISSWLTKPGIERAAFEIIYLIIGRDRKIKLKIYPVFGYVFIFGLIFIFRSKEDIATAFASMPQSNYHIFLLYLCFMVLQVAINEIPYSDDFKASWIYFSAPIDKPGLVLSGVMKAIFVRLFIPAYLLIACVVVAIWGLPVLFDIVFAAFNNVLMLLCLITVNKRFLPLSMAPNARNQAGSFMRSMMLLVLIGIMGVGHYLLSGKTLWILSLIPIQLVLIYVLYTIYQRTRWSSVSV